MASSESENEALLTAPALTPGSGPVVADAWDTVDLAEEFAAYVPTMRTLPRCIRGAFLQIYGQSILQLEQAYSRQRPS